MIELKDITKRYGKTTAVDLLNLTLKRGEIFGFIGPNGAGKTTTIRMIGGVLSPTAGSISVAGISMAEHPEEAKKIIGFIPDRPYLYEKLTGMEFMRFSADLYGVKDGVFLEKSRLLLHRFGLSDWADDLIEAYSHGMKQRLIIAAALLHEPQLLIVDEPMVGLDPAAIKLVKVVFKELSERGTTVFMSTHTLDMVEDLCDRIGIIHKGKLIAVGDIKELKKLAEFPEADLEGVFLRLTEK